MAERYLPLAGLDIYQIAPTVSGEMLRPLLESGADIRMHVNNGAVASFVDTVPLLHPYGRLICHDLFVTWGLHVCYGNRYARPSWEGHYDFLFPAVLDAQVGLLILEFGRKGYEDLQVIQGFGWDRALGLGVVDVKTEQIESAELIAQRIRKALDTFPADKLIINPTVGCATFPPMLPGRSGSDGRRNRDGPPYPAHRTPNTQ